MTHPEDGTLNDYVDGRLDRAAVERVEAHLAACGDCRDRVTAIRELNARLAGLPRGIAPRRDLLPGIRKRLDAGDRHAAATPAALGAPAPAGRSTARHWRRAAAIVLALSGAGTAVWLGVQARTATTPVMDAYASAAEELARAVEAEKTELGPGGLRALDASLASLDAAIGELERARHVGRRDPELLRQLEARHRARLEILRSAADLLEES